MLIKPFFGYIYESRATVNANTDHIEIFGAWEKTFECPTGLSKTICAVIQSPGRDSVCSSATGDAGDNSAACHKTAINAET